MEEDNYFIDDKETEKLNIHTTKQFYNALDREKRQIFKRYCLWSSKQECWVSKAKAENCPYLKVKLSEMGFVDGGTVGERLSFGDKVQKEQEKATVRAERAEKRAEKAQQRSNSLYNSASEMASAIPMGQPILVGHHSEKRDRRYRERIHNTMGKSVKEQEKSDYYKEKAKTAEWTAKGEKYRNPRYLNNRIKEAKAAVRLYGRYLEGKFHRGYPAREISEREREVYTTRLEENREKLDFYEKCMVEIDPAYLEKKDREKVKKANNRKNI